MTERSRQGGKRLQVEVAFASLRREFRLGETLASILIGLATTIAAKIAAYTRLVKSRAAGASANMDEAGGLGGLLDGAGLSSR